MNSTQRHRRIRPLIILILLAAAAAGAWITLEHGYSARATPSSLEVFVARRLRKLATPREARALQNPVPEGSAALAAGMEHFADHCASCHANDGSGSIELGRGMYPKPPDMRTALTQDLSDGEIYYIIENGVRFTGMPAFGDGSASAEGTWNLVHFIRHLPQLTDDELARMKDLNPKSPAEIKQEDEIQRFLRGEEGPPQLHHH